MRSLLLPWKFPGLGAFHNFVLAATLKLLVWQPWKTDTFHLLHELPCQGAPAHGWDTRSHILRASFEVSDANKQSWESLMGQGMRQEWSAWSSSDLKVIVLHAPLFLKRQRTFGAILQRLFRFSGWVQPLQHSLNSLKKFGWTKKPRSIKIETLSNSKENIIKLNHINHLNITSAFWQKQKSSILKQRRSLELKWAPSSSFHMMDSVTVPTSSEQNWKTNQTR